MTTAPRSALQLDFAFVPAACAAPGAPTRDDWLEAAQRLPQHSYDREMIEHDAENSDSWAGPSSSASHGAQSSWLTAVAVWQTQATAHKRATTRSEIDSSSASTSEVHAVREAFLDASLGDKPVARGADRNKHNLPPSICVAVAMADNSIWLFGKEESMDKRLHAIDTASTPTDHKLRSPSPSPSERSSSSRCRTHHGREQSLHVASGGLSAFSASSPTTTTTNTSHISPSAAEWRASSSSATPSSQQQRPSLDALESRLEAQYHSGSNREGVVGGMMEALGLSKHNHHAHPHTHQNSPPSAGSSKSRADSRRSSVYGSATPATLQSAKPSPGQSPDMSRTSSQTDSTLAASAPSFASSRRQQGHHFRNPTRDVKTGVYPSRPKSLRSSSAEGYEAGKPHKEASLASSREGRKEDMSSQARSGGTPAVPEWPPMRPIARLDTPPNYQSRILSLATCTFGGATSSNDNASPDTLLILHQSGLLTVWSLKDSTVLADFDLSRPDVRNSMHLPSAPDALQPGSSGGLVASTLAALRSHTNSPAPSAKSSSHPHTHERGDHSAKRAALSRTSSFGTRPGSSHEESRSKSCSFMNLTVVRHGRRRSDSAPEVQLAMYDADSKELVAATIHQTAQGEIKLQCTNLVALPDCVHGQHPIITNDGAGLIQTMYMGRDRRSMTTVTLTKQSDRGDKPSQNDHQITVHPLPECLGEQTGGCLPVAPGKALVWSRQLCILAEVDVSAQKLKELARLENDSIQGLESVQRSSMASPYIALLKVGHGSSSKSMLLKLGENDSGQATLALESIEKPSSQVQSVVVAMDNLQDFKHHAVLSANADADGRLSLTLQSRMLDGESSHTTSHELYRSQHTYNDATIKGLLPFSMDRIVVIMASGHVVFSSLANLVHGRVSSESAASPPCAAASLRGVAVSFLQTVINPRSPDTKLIVAGFSNGDVAFWDSTTLRLQAEWTLFSTSTQRIAVFGNEDNTLRLNGCVAISAADGSVAVIALDGLKLLYLIPGRGFEAPLDRLAVRVDEVMLMYRDGRARVWDMSSQELRRSIGHEQALSILEDGAGAWSQHWFDNRPSASNGQEHASSGVVSGRPNQEGWPSLGVNTRRALEAASKAASSLSVKARTEAAELAQAASAVSGDGTAASISRPTPTRPGSASSANRPRPVVILSPLLLALWPHQINLEMDRKLSSLLRQPDTEAALHQKSLVTGLRCVSENVELQCSRQVLATSEKSTAGFCLSPRLTASHMLALISGLRILARSSAEANTAAQALMQWLTDVLPSQTASWQPADLAQIALHLFDTVQEIQDTAQELFHARIWSMTSLEIDTLCQQHRPRLSGRLETAAARQALCLLGGIAVHLYSSLDPAVLKDIAAAVSSGIRQAASPTTLVALELCLRGFPVWQNYIDAMQLLRSVWSLAMAPEGDSAANEARSCARRVVVAIAEENTPLFMTTLHLDLLQASHAPPERPQAPTSDHPLSAGRNSSSTSQQDGHAPSAATTMRLVAFMVRLRPQLLVPSLPRLAEAVVKSLDPTSSASHRDVLLPSATLLIGELVKAYGTITFHRPSQRLAVATHEGAIVLYDLRSATRLFVLEGGHSGWSIDAISFSPHDGRRLISVSWSEGKLLAWKVGTSVVGWFKPGVMPRQGGNEAKGEVAYKTLMLRGKGSQRGLEEAPNVRVSFSWKGDRAVTIDVFEAGEEEEDDVHLNNAHFDVN